MKKGMARFKTIQLTLMILIAAACLVIIFTDEELYQTIGHNASVRNLCILTWLALVLSFAAIFVDYRMISTAARHYRELDHYVSNDPIAGIANRFSCDAMIEQYADKPLPETVGCVMLEISNLRAINQTYGHTMGNATIQAFSDILSSSAVDLCFVGRNGGNKFMALFEDCTEEKINVFLNRMRQKIEQHDRQPGVPAIEYRCGKAFREGEAAASITQLISLADRRISSRRDTITGIANRESLDEIIELYEDKPLPDTVGCIMLELTNLRDINKSQGHASGNLLLRRFSDILRESAQGLCFVGRNGGTCFVALFEQCSRESMDAFIDGVKRRVHSGNEAGNLAVRFSWGGAFREEGVDTIGELLACASQKRFDHPCD